MIRPRRIQIVGSVRPTDAPRAVRATVLARGKLVDGWAAWGPNGGLYGCYPFRWQAVIASYELPWAMMGLAFCVGFTAGGIIAIMRNHHVI